MNEHHCLLCMGSNTNRFTQLSDARKVLSEAFPDIHFGELMETQSESVHNLFKELERHSGRLPGDKAQGIVKLDIDLLTFDNKVLKPEDMKREYIRRGISLL